jgi:hypothetical protein
VAVLLSLRTDSDGKVTPFLDGQPLAEPTHLASLPSLKTLQAAPYAQGRSLTTALGGDAVIERLDADPDRLLLLAADDAADKLPWEFAALRAASCSSAATAC